MVREFLALQYGSRSEKTAFCFLAILIYSSPRLAYRQCVQVELGDKLPNIVHWLVNLQ